MAGRMSVEVTGRAPGIDWSAIGKPWTFSTAIGDGPFKWTTLEIKRSLLAKV